MQPRPTTSRAAARRSARSGPVAVLCLVVLSLGVLGLCGLCACGGDTATTAASAVPTPTPTPSTAFKPWPPGTASPAQALAVAEEYAARARAEKPMAGLVVPGWTIDVWIADAHFSGHAATRYMGRSPQVLDWSRGTALATDGAAVVEQVVTNAGEGLTMPSLEVLSIDGGKITHLEVFGNGGDPGAQITRPRPVAGRPGPADDAAAAGAVATAYYVALAKADAAAAAALYSPQAVFQDTATAEKPGGTQEAAAWFAKVAAVPDKSMEVKSVIAGAGWAVARWVFSGTASTHVYSGVRGATLFEVRDGKIVRQTVYYSLPGSPFS
jgi:steroid delta-isomerase-like uncharacterized protein